MNSDADRSTNWLLLVGFLLLAGLGLVCVSAAHLGSTSRHTGPARAGTVLDSLDESKNSPAQRHYGEGSWTLHATPNGVVGVQHR